MFGTIINRCWLVLRNISGSIRNPVSSKLDLNKCIDKKKFLSQSMIHWKRVARVLDTEWLTAAKKILENHELASINNIISSPDFSNSQKLLKSLFSISKEIPFVYKGNICKTSEELFFFLDKCNSVVIKELLKVNAFSEYISESKYNMYGQSFFEKAKKNKDLIIEIETKSPRFSFEALRMILFDDYRKEYLNGLENILSFSGNKIKSTIGDAVKKIKSDHPDYSSYDAILRELPQNKNKIKKELRQNKDKIPFINSRYVIGLTSYIKLNKQFEIFGSSLIHHFIKKNSRTPNLFIHKDSSVIYATIFGILLGVILFKTTELNCPFLPLKSRLIQVAIRNITDLKSYDYGFKIGGITFKYIKGNEFKPLKSTVSDFFISETEITYDQFDSKNVNQLNAKSPVINIDWSEMNKFAQDFLSTHNKDTHIFAEKFPSNSYMFSSNLPTECQMKYIVANYGNIYYLKGNDFIACRDNYQGNVLLKIVVSLPLRKEQTYRAIGQFKNSKIGFRIVIEINEKN